MSPFQVTVRRRGVSPLTLTMVVKADSPSQAAGLATTVAEFERGGMFEAGRVRAARRSQVRDYIDAEAVA